mmetsp:Transcript_4172/g.4289  ORF Transcript_4172/g.4289 Transcript_4172/m.4289 type:complete len:254 (-) Transcript_4172:178-939(-)
MVMLLSAFPSRNMLSLCIPLLSTYNRSSFLSDGCLVSKSSQNARAPSSCKSLPSRNNFCKRLSDDRTSVANALAPSIPIRVCPRYTSLRFASDLAMALAPSSPNGFPSMYRMFHEQPPRINSDKTAAPPGPISLYRNATISKFNRGNTPASTSIPSSPNAFPPRCSCCNFVGEQCDNIPAISSAVRSVLARSSTRAVSNKPADAKTPFKHKSWSRLALSDSVEILPVGSKVAICFQNWGSVSLNVGGGGGGGS